VGSSLGVEGKTISVTVPYRRERMGRGKGAGYEMKELFFSNNKWEGDWCRHWATGRGQWGREAERWDVGW